MAEQRFKTGDKVRRLSEGVEDWGIEKGDVYTVDRGNAPGTWSITVQESPGYSFDPLQFELVAPTLEDELRKNYPKVYDDLVAAGKYDLAPRDDVFTVTVATRASNHETEETVLDFLTAVAGAGSGMRFSDVKRVS